MPDEKLEKELQDNYVDNETKKGAAISMGVGTIAGYAAGEATAALAIGGSIIAAPVAIPAFIVAATIGLVGTGVSYVAAKSKKIEALKKDGLKTALEGAKYRLFAAMEQIGQYDAAEIIQQNEKNKLLKEISKTEENMKKQEILFKEQVAKHGYTRNSSQIIVVMIGKTGHGKSTLGNRICGDRSKKGNQGPFTVSSKKDKAGTTEVISTITTAPFQNMISGEGITSNNPFFDDIKEESDTETDIDEESSVLIVDTPGWGDVEEANRDDHKNLMIRYLKGCGGVNSFLMVMSNRDRIDSSMQQMLGEYEKLFGIEFWKHLIIIITGIDDKDDLEEFEEEDHVKDIQRKLKEKFILSVVLHHDVPVIPIGKKVYKKQIPLIIEMIPTDKFICDALKGPYELLQETYLHLIADAGAVENKLKELRKNIISKSKEIKQLRNSVDEIRTALSNK